jgi:hypothetical protein
VPAPQVRGAARHQRGTAVAPLFALTYACRMNRARVLPWKRTVVALLLFGTAFGYLEAAVVSYLRLLHEPARQQFYPGRATAELFPLLTLNQLRSIGHRAAANPRG